MSTQPTVVVVDPGDLAAELAARVGRGERFAGLVGSARADGATVLDALLAGEGAVTLLEAVLPAGTSSYPSLTPAAPAAAWYERELADLFGLQPVGHPSLDPLVLPLAGRASSLRPRPGSGRPLERATLDLSPLPVHVTGEGVFTLPYGPVRSGVFESVEYLLETPGEEIPHLRTRLYHKHRGLESRFAGLDPADGALLAERVEGTSSVAHAVAYCQALEALAGVEPPRTAQLVRVVHAELERVAGHLDSVVRHAEGAGQAVAYARLSLHKERLMRLRASLCGHRFGRGVVVPGGVAAPLQVDPAAVLGEVGGLQAALEGDLRALMSTPSFVDRLRGTGRLPAETAALYGALGPVGRASGVNGDVRAERAYGAYCDLGFEQASGSAGGDALSRQEVRLFEIAQSLQLARRALHELEGSDPELSLALSAGLEGRAVGSVEAPQGELVYLLELEAGRLRRASSRTASFHNLALFHEAFSGDIFTDFAFIEASFGLSIAGAAR